MDSLLQDIRYAVRTCVRTPGFTLVAVVALAIGIGANTAIFTIVDAVLLEPLPFKEPHRLVALWEENARRPGRANTVAPANFIRWTERATAFESIAGFVDTRANITGGRDPEEIVVQNVTAPFFATLGVSPILGRTFSSEETRVPDANVTVLSFALWQRRFAADPAIVGKSIQLNARPVTVVGVMPPGFSLLFRSNSLTGKPADAWVPWVLPASAREPRGRFMSVVARLKAGVSADEAQVQMRAIMAAVVTEIPMFDTGWTAEVIPLRDELSRNVRPALLVLFGAVAFVLLIACANVANLLLARGAARQREFALRSAIGAQRTRLVRQLLTETLILAIGGGALGLLLAAWMLAGLTAVSPLDLATLPPIHLNRAVLAFTAAVSLLVTVVAGVAPALESSRTDVSAAIQDGARQVGGGIRARRWRDAFIVAEVALAVVLLIGAGLLLRSFATLRSVNPGFDPSNVLTMRVQLPPAKYDKDDQRTRFFRDAVARVATLPGVTAAGATSFLPFAGLGAATDFSVVGRPPLPPGQANVTEVAVCDNGYFKAMRIGLLKGRLFSDREMREKSNVVIVSEELVAEYFPNEDPIGKRLVIDMTDTNVPTEIIGVVSGIKTIDLVTALRPISYWPHPQLAYSTMTLTVRTAGDPMSVVSSATRAIHGLDPDQPVADVRTMQQWVGKSLAETRFTSTLLGLFAAVALLLAAIGLYGVITYVVGQRTSEIGVRIALGAVAGEIVRMVVGDGMRVAGFGLVIGLALALLLTRAVSALLYQTRPADPLTFAAVIGVLAAVAFVASYIPARRAAGIDPAQALRHE